MNVKHLTVMEMELLLEMIQQNEEYFYNGVQRKKMLHIKNKLNNMIQSYSM